MLYTPKLNLTKPEDNDGLDACRNNWDKLDTAYSGALWVPADFVPSNDALFDGAIIAEIGTGIVWRAERTLTGNFSKHYLKYPYLLSAQTLNYAFPVSDTANHPYGWIYQSNESVNVNPTTDLVGTYWIVPITGTYLGQITHFWAPQAGGLRVVSLGVNDFTGVKIDYETVTQGSANDSCFHTLSFNSKFTKGDRVISLVWQNSGVAPINSSSTLRVALMEAL